MKKVFLLILILYFGGCENFFSPEFTLAWEPPVITEVVVTNSEFLTDKVNLSLPVWRYKGSLTTIDFDEIKDLYINSNPLYLNPQELPGPQTAIAFAISKSGRVRLSILPARAPNEEAGQVMKRFSGATHVQLRSGGVVLVDDYFAAGTYSVIFKPYEMNLPSGFYIYRIETETLTITRNLYFTNTCEEALPELRIYISKCRENV